MSYLQPSKAYDNPKTCSTQAGQPSLQMYVTKALGYDTPVPSSLGNLGDIKFAKQQKPAEG